MEAYNYVLVCIGIAWSIGWFTSYLIGRGNTDLGNDRDRD